MDRNPVVVYIKREEDSEIPTQGYEDDAGHDLYVTERTWIEPHSFMDVPTGISIAPPASCWGLILHRSSTIRVKGLRVEAAVIDPGYRGEMRVGVWNLGDKPIMIDAGDRIAQLIFIERVPVLWREVDSLPPSARGANGFGSSGV